MAEKQPLPKPIYSTDFYLAAVLVELKRLNKTMDTLLDRRTQPTNTAAKPTKKS